ncbi:MAG: phosphoribosylformylglycinamidine synthase subunit PurL, partial [Alphaproteobacteria bacterium]|nr:phosphoribosylformylglycinamidine synthase subunit PurL [Alphaproteobacteria bacterium]
MPQINNAVLINDDIAQEHGLTIDEYNLLKQLLKRTPNLTELGIVSVMWSEHCSYKSSRKWLKTLPTTAPHVIQGPGENAGVIDIGDNQALVFKMESHNHPSYIEPYQGAATGVGGIMRDIFTMGARPIANLNALRFGDPTHEKTRHLLSGVVAGIAGYGNCMGVPTVGGEINFHASYNDNILVNAMTVGLADKDKIFYSKAAGVGNPVIYVGAKTGRDGIHGATMASAEFDHTSSEDRPTVQIGDPFTEKLLLEACLELMQEEAIIAIQDMGAAGLTSSSVEMCSKGNLGMEITLDHVPVRETEMTAYEMMLSESQERMLMILKPDSMEKAKSIFNKWGLDFATIGFLTERPFLTLSHHQKICADLPISILVDAAPAYQRPYINPAKPQDIQFPANFDLDLIDCLKKLVSSPDLCSRRWVWQQYDYIVRGQTHEGPGGDAALIRIDPYKKAVAITTDCTPRYCQADPYR